MTTYGLPPEPPVGLHQKYTVTRNDGQDRPGARYFVINYAADPAAMAALAAYADAVESDNPKLAADLRTLIEPEPSDMNPDDIATETIMPEAFLDLARRMVAQKSPEAAATAALAWALRHAPVDGGCTLEISGHRIERIAPEPDTWSTEPLIVASVDGGAPQLLVVQDDDTAMTMTGALCRRDRDTLSNVVPVRVVPVAELDALRASIKALGYGPDGTTGMPGSLLDTALRLLDAADALGVSND